EDGIRVDLVTGVQTCALPISGPVSLTLMYWPPEAVQPTLSQTSPPDGVNLIAFDRKFRQTCRSARSSAQSRGSSGSNVSCTVMRSEERRVGKECKAWRSLLT